MTKIDPKYVKIIESQVLKKMTDKNTKPSYLIILGLVLILVLLTSYFLPIIIEKYQNPKPQTEKTALDTNQIYIVKRVVDGDTVELDDGQRVRYLNVDTPESVKPGVPPQCFSLNAKAENEKMLGNKRIKLTFDKQKTDRYGRILAYVFPENTTNFDIKNSINVKLVENGFAKGLFIRPNLSNKDYFIKLENEAQKKKIGLWGVCPKPFEE